MFDDFKPEEGSVGRTPPAGTRPAQDDASLKYQGGPLDGEYVEVDHDLITGDWPERVIQRVWHADHEVVFIDQYDKRATYGDLFNTRVKTLPYIYSLGRDGIWRYQQGVEGVGWNLVGRVAFGH